MAVNIGGSSPAGSTSLARRIDAHHHFWIYNRDDYDWITDSMSNIRRDFSPEHLVSETRACGIDGVVSVQARQSVEESDWLLKLASQYDLIRGVVGWVPLIAPDVSEIIGRLVDRGPLKAVRHVLQGEADESYMLRDDFNRGIEAVGELGLVYDILILERQLSQTIRLVDRHPNQIFVVDHIAKPRIRDRILSPWKQTLSALAERPNVYCKISGMVTEADHNSWSEKDLAPYFDIVLHSFGPERLMFGSDWPVCLVATTYRRWFDLVSEQFSALSRRERDAIFGGTAVRVYGLEI